MYIFKYSIIVLFMSILNANATNRIERLNPEDALELILIELDMSDANNINKKSGPKHSDVSVLVKWKTQQNRIRNIIKQTEDIYGFGKMSNDELETLKNSISNIIKITTPNNKLQNILKDTCRAAEQEQMRRTNKRSNHVED